MKKIIFTITIFLLSSCGFLESSSLIIKNKIIGNYTLIIDKNDLSSMEQLVLINNENGYITIKSKCKEVFLSNPYIYVKSFALTNNDTIYFFNKITIIEEQYIPNRQCFKDELINEDEFIEAKKG